MNLLYEHTKAPTHWGVAIGCPSVSVSNPGCGDRQRLFLRSTTAGGATVLFQATGCSLSRAATSILLESTEGFGRDQVLDLDHVFLNGLIGVEVVQSRPRCILLGLGALKELAGSTAFTNLTGDEPQ
jgi:nitrogen fixation NifU-like protein